MKIQKPRDSALNALISQLNGSDPAFVELRADVRRLLASPGEPRLRPILKKIAAMQFELSRSVMRFEPLIGKRRPDSPNVLYLGGEWVAVVDRPLIKGSRVERARQLGYWTLDRTLKSGEFSRIKTCRVCSNVFATYRQDAEACSPKCNRTYHNRKRLRSGYFKTNYKQNKEKNLKKARRLLKEKHLPLIAEEIQKKDLAEVLRQVKPLTKLALIRNGILERSENL